MQCQQHVRRRDAKFRTLVMQWRKRQHMSDAVAEPGRSAQRCEVHRPYGRRLTPPTPWLTNMHIYEKVYAYTKIGESWRGKGQGIVRVKRRLAGAVAARAVRSSSRPSRGLSRSSQRSRHGIR